MRTAFTAFVLLAAAWQAAAQNVPRVGETIDVSIINLDVVVTDHRGHHVRGLTAADFEVRDNGVVQPITNFAEYAEQQPAAMQTSVSGALAAQPTPEARREKRTILVYVERMVLLPSVADALVASLKDFLHQALQPGDSAGLVSFQYAIKIEQDLTSDPAQLDRACDKVRKLFDRVADDPETELIRRAYLQEVLDEDMASIGQPSAPAQIFSGRDQADIAMLDMRRKIDGLNRLINSMAGTEGRKALLLVTHRFSRYAGAEFFGGEVPFDYRRELETYDLRKQLAANANAAGVTIYTVFPEGLGFIPTGNVEERPRRNIGRNDSQQDAAKLGKANVILTNETAPLTELAASTGGVAGWGNSDFSKVVHALRDDLASYYSIGFREPRRSATTHHHIEVMAKNRQYSVRSRSEYVAKSDAMQMSDRIAASLYQPLRASSIPLDVELQAVTKKGRRFHIPLVLRIPTSSLMTDNGSGSFRVYAAAGGQLGIMSEVYEKSQPFTLHAAGQPPLFTYSLEIVTDARADRIVVGVLDEVSKQSGLVRVMLTEPVQTGR